MSIEIPGWLATVAEVAAGHFPEGDEDALWRLRDAYAAAAQAVQGVAQDGETTTQRSMAAMQGQANLALDQYWKSFSTGDGAYLTQLEQLCTDLSQSCDSMALETEYTKLSVIAALVALAAQIAALVASAFVTFGASTAAVPVAMAGTRAIIIAIVRAMITEIIKAVLINVATTVGLQGIQILEGHRSLSQFDFGKVGDAVKDGAIDGAISGLTGFGAEKLGAAALGDAATRGETAAFGAVTGTLTGTVDTQASSLAHGDGFASAEDTLRGQATGALGGAQDGYDGYDESHKPPSSSSSTSSTDPGGPGADPNQPTHPAPSSPPGANPDPNRPNQPPPSSPPPSAGSHQTPDPNQPTHPAPSSPPGANPDPNQPNQPPPSSPPPGSPSAGAPDGSTQSPDPSPEPEEEGGYSAPEVAGPAELDPDPMEAPEEHRPIPSLNLP